MDENERPEVVWLDGDPLAWLDQCPPGTDWRNINHLPWQSAYTVTDPAQHAHARVVVVAWPDGSTPAPPPVAVQPDPDGPSNAMPAGLLTGIGPKWPEGAATIKAWANSETIEGPDLVRELAAWLAYFGGAPTATPAAIQLRSTPAPDPLAVVRGSDEWKVWRETAAAWDAIPADEPITDEQVAVMVAATTARHALFDLFVAAVEPSTDGAES